ncbi:sigma-70 family RNA polymerase sigma factor [Antribacter sp. KLBMP9083]|uniref:Sigma-70 family RNA polymerase sigma factor n=1 Tax=Antribacter soli TaxID=2910976 RepID=A0AA41QI96_9MICO|nr:sigma-70 family RNA polymerase sigma factor [Antribacter soli]MCF4123245.1 sigma-70 family RNA polymerase sigma factor [Antribacter soli]
MTFVDGSAGDAPSDAELILKVREGDRQAFGLLYERHMSATLRFARCLVSPSDAEEIVQSAYEGTLQALLSGKGPDLDFRGYVYQTVRHTAYNLHRGARRTRPSTDDELEFALGRFADEDDPALKGFEQTIVYQAYDRLPERFKLVLRYALVEEQKPAQIAPILGLNPNGVSALIYRAKSALRDGYLQQHLTHAPSEACRDVNARLGEYVRGSLSKRETVKVEEHTAGCSTCSDLVLELHDVAHGMKCVIAPLMLGVAALGLVGTALPVGGLAVGAAKAGTAASAAAGFAKVGAASSAAGGAGTTATLAPSGTLSAGATTTAGSTAISSSAATSTAAGTTAAGTTAAGTTASAGASASVATATTGAAAATTGAAAATGTGAVVAGAAGVTVMSGGAAAAGVITAATVGVAAILQVLAPTAGAGVSDAAGAAVTMSTERWAQGNPLPGYLDPSSPSNLLAPLTTLLPPEPPEIGLGYADPAVVLEPRTPQDVVLSVSNTGGDATGTFVRLTLPDGLTASFDEAPFGAGTGTVADGSSLATGDTETEAGTASGTTAGPSVILGPPTTADPLACTPATNDGGRTVLCSLGTVAGGTQQHVVVGVKAEAGGAYAIGAEVWAEGVTPASVELPARSVAAFGPELSATAGSLHLANPGSGSLPIEVGNTGDVAAEPGWSVIVTLPAGVAPASAQSILSCAAVDVTAANDWSCAPVAGSAAGSTPLAAGAWRTLPLTVLADGTTPTAEAGTSSASASVLPVLPGSSKVLSGSATLSVASAWAGAAAGAGAVVTQCLARGGVGTADAVVQGTYTNTTGQTVSVRLEAAGSGNATVHYLAPGEQAPLILHDGLRLPAGEGTYVLSAVVDERTFSTRVPAGWYGAQDCYDPAWTANASARTVNEGGTVAVEGTLTNTTGEPLQATMEIVVDGTRLESQPLRVEAGATVTTSVATGQTRLHPGDVTFRLSRWTVDSDGDAPAAASVAAGPSAAYNGAVIAPQVGDLQWEDACQFDDTAGTSERTFRVPVDNRDSTLPVVFEAAGVSVLVRGGHKDVLVVTVPWGTGTVDVRADGRPLATLMVGFESCAQVSWPQDMVVTAGVQCVDGHVQVFADLQNPGGITWSGWLVRGSGITEGEGPAKEVPAGGTAQLVLDRPLAASAGSHVTVRLSRVLEGTAWTVEQTHDVPGIYCPPAPIENVADESGTSTGTSDVAADSGDTSPAAAWWAGLFGTSQQCGAVSAGGRGETAASRGGPRSGWSPFEWFAECEPTS